MTAVSIMNLDSNGQCACHIIYTLHHPRPGLVFQRRSYISTLSQENGTLWLFSPPVFPLARKFATYTGLLEEVDSMDEEQRIAAARANVSEIYEALSTNPSAWQFSLTSARGAMTAIDATMFMRRRDQLEDQAWLVSGLQKLAYHEADVGAVIDVSEWCLRSWLVILQNHPNNVEVLKGSSEFQDKLIARVTDTS